MSRPGLEQLQDAIVSNRREEVHALLDGGLSVNAKLPQAHTPLTLALLHRHWQLAEELFERGADPEHKVNSYSCLAWACSYHQGPLAEKLLERIVSVNARDSSGHTPLYWAVCLESTRFVDSLLARGAQVDGKQGSSPLFLATSRGNLEICRQLIAAGARLDQLDYGGNSLLHAAVLSSRLPVLELLLEREPELIDAVNKERQTALHLAAQFRSGDRPMIEKLLAAGAQPEQRDRMGQTPIILAAAFNTASVLKALMARGAEFSQADRTIALKLAIEAERKEQVARLMLAFDFTRPLDKQHPLRVAISQRRWSIVETLLGCGVDPESRVAESGDPLLPWSMKQLLPELARILVEAGATSERERALLWLDNLMLMGKVGKVWLNPGGRPDDQPLSGHLLAALQKNIEPLGFVMTPELAERVLTLTDPELEAFYQLLVPSLRAIVGADKACKPMYPNFPRQVKETPESELYLNAFLHYLGDAIGRRIMPYYDKLPRLALSEKPALKPIGLAAPDEPQLLFRRLLEARGALTPQDKKVLSWLVLSRGDSIAGVLPEEVPFRENAALLAAALLRFTNLHRHAASYLKNGLDVLRTATAYCGGDVSLATNTKFGKFSKSCRRFFLAGLEADSNLEESLWRQPEKFKRLGEKLHPGEYRKRFPRTWEAFRQLRSGHKPATFGGRLEGHLSHSEVEACLPLLRSRPGEFARRLDHLLRLSRPEQAEAVLTTFHRVIAQVPTPLLLQLRKHFQSRNLETPLRVFFPKGDLAKLQAVDNTLPPLAPSLCSRLEELCREALVSAYAARPPLGACWLDERLKSYTVPFALRSASKALRTIARGSRIPFGGEEGVPQETIRFFIWWRDGQSRTDLDLSALVLDGDFNFQTTLAYYNLRELGGYHSGDITSAPKGASEFIDIEVPTFLGRDARYVMMVVSSFTAQPYCDLPECFAGFMRREHPDSGEIYEPRTVLNKFDLTANTTIAIPLILDLRKREVIWTDLSLKRNPSRANNVHGNRSSLALLCEAMVNLRRPSLYELFELHIAARGQLVSERGLAQTVFTAEAANHGVTPYDIPVILSEYL